MQGRVVKNTGSWYHVETASGEIIPCKVKGTFRLKGIRNTNPVAIGDWVSITPNENGTAFITEITERKNYIIRKSSNLSKEGHILASNIDQALLMVCFSTPQTHVEFIDRFLATAQAYRIPVKLLINKIDSYDAQTNAYAEAVATLYRSIGYESFFLSAQSGTSIAEIEALISGKISLISGNSGVGKTTLINRLLPGLNLRTASVSTSHNKGMHTTTFSEMFALPQGGYIIDTPGVKGFGTIDFKTEEIAHYFPEIFVASHDCRFGNCTHRHEPGCAVLAAVEEHRISESRYNSYLSILEDASDGKYRTGKE